MSEENSPTDDPPACERCGGNTFATMRRMRTYDISSGQAVPHDSDHPVWRCFRCSGETPRTA
jgi:hypothetical protein